MPDPVGHAQERCPPPAPQVASGRRGRGDVAPGRDDANALGIDAGRRELGGQRLACHEQQPGPPIGEAVERRLQRRAPAAMIDAAGGLVQDGDHRDRG